MVLALGFMWGCTTVSVDGDLTDQVVAEDAMMSIDSSDALEMSDEQSCSCGTLRCNGKVQAAACSISCEPPKSALCACGKCAYGAFNNCRCVG